MDVLVQISVYIRDRPSQMIYWLFNLIENKRKTKRRCLEYFIMDSECKILYENIDSKFYLVCVKCIHKAGYAAQN